MKKDNALEVTDSIIVATKRYVDSWITVLWKERREALATLPRLPAPIPCSSSATNDAKQPQTLQLRELCLDYEGAPPVHHFSDSRLPAEPRLRTSADVDIPSKHVAKVTSNLNTQALNILAAIYSDRSGPSHPQNAGKQPEPSLRSGFSTGSWKRDAASPFRHAPKWPLPAKRRLVTDNAFDGPSKEIAKPTARRSSTCRREPGRLFGRVLKKERTNAVSKKPATCSAERNFSRNSMSARSKSPPLPANDDGFTTWKYDYSARFAPHIVPSKKGPAYYKCQLCDRDLQFGKQGSDAIKRHLRNSKHVSRSRLQR